MYKVLDLFAGAGGLSWGFAKTGRYEIVLAYENNKHAQETYKANHDGAQVKGDVREAEAIGFDNLNREYGPFDVVIGGPPCQGFSNANRQRRRLVNQNNKLVKWYVEFVEQLKPRAFVLENVSMLKSETHRFYMEQGDQNLVEEFHVPIRKDALLLHEGSCPVLGIELDKKSALMELAIDSQALSFLRLLLKYAHKPERRAKLVERLGQGTQQYLALLRERSVESKKFADLESAAMRSLQHFLHDQRHYDNLLPALERYVAVQEMIVSAMEILDHNILVEDYGVEADGSVVAHVSSYSVIDYIRAKLGREYHFNGDLLNAAEYGVPQRRERYVAVGVRRSLLERTPHNLLPEGALGPDQYRTVWDAIGDLEAVAPTTSIHAEPIEGYEPSVRTRLTEALTRHGSLYNHVATATRETARERFRALAPGQNFHDLDVSLRENTFSRPERTQRTIYSRLDYEKPSPTVLNVRKSMWIHPVFDRAISIREAARLQSFPDDFVFKGPKDSQYQQVGNAVPPFLAYAIANHLADILDNQGTEMTAAAASHSGSVQ